MEPLAPSETEVLSGSDTMDSDKNCDSELNSLKEVETEVEGDVEGEDSSLLAWIDLDCDNWELNERETTISLAVEEAKVLTF